MSNYIKKPICHYETKECSSILGTVNTGFGDDNILHKDPPKLEYHSHLCKENYLSEFNAPTEKKLARNNLGVYGKEEVDSAVKSVTKLVAEVDNKISKLNLIDAVLKTETDYQIPNNLFKL